MRYEVYKKNEYYILSGYGAHMSQIFIDEYDYARFIFLIIFLQSPIRHNNVFWYTNRFIKKGNFGITEERILNILKVRQIELIAFSILPNQFHLAVRNLEDNIISVYMQRILTAYGKFYNSKYNKRGHVFSGPYQALKLNNEDSLLKAISDIHLSPNKCGLKHDSYLWTSYIDYVDINRWGSLLNTNKIITKFKNQAEYKLYLNKLK